MQKQIDILRTLGVCALVGAIMLAVGCGEKEDDGTYDPEVSRLVSGEIADMGLVTGDMVNGSLPKTAVAADTITGQLTIRRFAWDSSFGGYVREAVLTTSEGYERIRLDTIVFRDAVGSPQRYPSLTTTRTIEHVRHMSHNRNGICANVRFMMTTALMVRNTDTLMVRNGSLHGVVNDQEIATASVSNVTSRRVAGLWRFPESGTVVVDFPVWSYTLEYTGNGRARATITNRNRGRTWVVDVNYLQ